MTLSTVVTFASSALDLIKGTKNLPQDQVLKTEPPPNIARISLDPLTTVAQLALLCLKPAKTKIYFDDYQIQYNSPGPVGAMERSGWSPDLLNTSWSVKATHDDLECLENPIMRAAQLFQPNENPFVWKIFSLGKKGLERLKVTYYAENKNFTGKHLNELIKTMKNAMDNGVPKIKKPRTFYIKLLQLWNEKEIKALHDKLVSVIEEDDKDQPPDFKTTSSKPAPSTAENVDKKDDEDVPETDKSSSGKKKDKNKKAPLKKEEENSDKSNSSASTLSSASASAKSQDERPTQDKKIAELEVFIKNKIHHYSVIANQETIRMHRHEEVE